MYNIQLYKTTQESTIHTITMVTTTVVAQTPLGHTPGLKWSGMVQLSHPLWVSGQVNVNVVNTH